MAHLTKSASFKKPFLRDKSKAIDVSIYERKAYEILVRTEEAKQWIEEMIQQKLPPGTASLSDSLRDGVYFCNLAESFMPGSVTKIHKPKIGSVLEFMAIDNYNQFFRACEKVAFPKLFMFEVTDLWEKKNVYKIVHCIHTLARFLAQKGKGVKIKNLSKAGLEFDEEEIQKTKEELQKMEEKGEAVTAMFDSLDAPAAPAPVSDDEESEEEEEEELADPDHCVIDGNGASAGVAGEVAQFTIKAKDASGVDINVGGEKFSVILFHKQDKSIQISATVEDLSNGTYQVSYTPTKAGEYSMEVHLVDEPDEEDKKKSKEDEVSEDGEEEEEEVEMFLLKGCPKIVTVSPSKSSDITKTEIVGIGSETAVAGIESTFQLLTNDKFGNRTLGGEHIQTTLVGINTKTPAKVTATVTDDGNGQYTVAYTCPMSGEYELDITLGATKIESKRIIVKDAGVSDANSSNIEPSEKLTKGGIKAGDAIELTIQAKDKHGNDRHSGGEKFSAKLVDAKSGEEIPVTSNELVDSNDGKYNVKLSTEKAGEFKLHIQLNGKDLQSSPIPVSVADHGVTDPATCISKVNEQLKEIRAGESRTISIEPRDKYGNKRKLSAEEQFALVTVSKTELTDSTPIVAHHNASTDTYDITFTLNKADEYALQCVLLTKSEGAEKSENIKGYPLDITLLDSGKAAAVKTKVDGEGLKRAVANQPSKFAVHTFDQYGNARKSGGDEVLVQLVNPKRNLTINAEVTDLEDGVHEVNYLPTTSGHYQVIVKVNGEVVDNEYLSKDALDLIVEAPLAKEIGENELDTIHDHDLLNSLVNSIHVEQDNENLGEEMQAVRESLIKQIKSNTQTETNIKETEKKIQLFVSNRQKLEQSMAEQRGGLMGLFGRRKPATNVQQDEQMTQLRKKLEGYSKLFYLLQTDPRYLSNCLYLVPGDKVDKFLETVILTLYGYAFSPREEYLILNLFKMTLQLEISKAKKLGGFLNNNPVLPKMVLTYGRRIQGQQFLQKILFDKIMTKIFNEKDLNLEINAAKILKENISKEEVRTGVKSTVNLRDITFQKAMEDEAVSKLVNERVDKLTEICQHILDGIIANVNEIPYGLRWVCKQLDYLLREKHKESTEAERAAVVGYIAYYRFMNPAIVSPDFFGLTKKNQKISANLRGSLVIISKVLTNLANNILFDAKIEAQMTLMNDWIKKNQKVYVEQFIRALVKVDDPEEALGVHQYMELTQKKSPNITITWNELFSTHGLLLQYLSKLAPESGDALRQVLDELGPAPAELPEEKNEELSLPLIPNVTKDVEKVQEVTPEQLYETVKDNFRFILRTLGVDNLGENVMDTMEKAKTVSNERLKQQPKVQQTGEGEKEALAKQQQNLEQAQQTLAKVKQIEDALPKLEEAQILTKATSYRRLLVDITKELQNQKVIRQKQRKDLERLKDSLKNLETHAQYLGVRERDLESYVNDIITQQFQQNPEEMKKRRGKAKKTSFGYDELKKKGVIVDLNVMKSQRSKISFAFSMPQPGIFDVEAKLAGMTVKTIALTLADLLDKQSKGTTQVQFDNVVLDVNMTLHLLNKLFSTLKN